MQLGYRNKMSLSNSFLMVFFYLSFFFFSLLLPVSTNSTPWASFHNLAGTGRGDTSPLLPELKKYLRRFGYLPSYSPSDLTDAAFVFDDDLRSAIRTYQQNFNLNVTGILDMPTVRQLMTPRCGVPDIINGTTSMSSGRNSFLGTRLYAYFPGQPRWPAKKQKLTYALTSTSAVNTEPSVLRSLFARAFRRWAEVTSFNFTEVSSNKADITIGFYSGDHGDKEPFDGPQGELAHTFAPTDGRSHYDASEDWVAVGDVTRSRDGNALDLESVVVHELGHVLGMGHSSVRKSVMFPSIPPRTRKVELSEDDVRGIRSLYGMH